MHDDISGWQPLGTVMNRLVGRLAHRRRNRCNGAVTQTATAIEQAETAVNAAIAALRTVLDAMQAPGDAADDPPASQSKRQA
jgi:hypothetical protein